MKMRSSWRECVLNLLRKLGEDFGDFGASLIECDGAYRKNGAKNKLIGFAKHDIRGCADVSKE